MKDDTSIDDIPAASYDPFLAGITSVLDTARRQAARTVNLILTAAYWEIGRRIVEFQQGGMERAVYGVALLKHLSMDLSRRFGRGFSVDNLENMRLFYLVNPPEKISETLSRKLGVAEKAAIPLQILTMDGLFTTEERLTCFDATYAA